MKRSKISSSTSRWRSSDLSILLMATIGLRPWASALPSTNLVCGIGPSAASTRMTTPSTMRKDALDFAAEVGVAGRVDDIDAGVLPEKGGHLGQNGDTALALDIVACPWRVLQRAGFRGMSPTACSRTSIRVVLPWSTWAIMAMLRRTWAPGRWAWSQAAKGETANHAENRETPAAFWAVWRFFGAAITEKRPSYRKRLPNARAGMREGRKVRALR